MPFPREVLAKKIADRLNLLADQLKTRTRASFTDANHSLEFVMERFFNALFRWKLVNLNADATDFPAADLGDDALRIAIQITNHDKSAKIKDARKKAVEHRLGARFDRLIVFFLLAKKPGMPGDFEQPADGPQIETWDLADLLKQMMSLDMNALVSAWEVLEEEMPFAESQYGPRHTLPPRSKRRAGGHVPPRGGVGGEPWLPSCSSSIQRIHSSEARQKDVRLAKRVGDRPRLKLHG